MKKLTVVSCLLALFVFGSGNLFAQYDDIYYDPSDSQFEEETTYYDSEEADYDESDESEYDEDFYEYEYSSRIRRFNRPYSGFGYYSTVYVDRYYYDSFYDPFAPNFTIYASNNPYNRRGRWYRPWRPYRSVVVYNPNPWGYGYNPWGPAWGNSWNRPWNVSNYYGYGYGAYGGYGANNYYCPSDYGVVTINNNNNTTIVNPRSGNRPGGTVIGGGNNTNNNSRTPTVIGGGKVNVKPTATQKSPRTETTRTGVTKPSKPAYGTTRTPSKSSGTYKSGSTYTKPKSSSRGTYTKPKSSRGSTYTKPKSSRGSTYTKPKSSSRGTYTKPKSSRSYKGSSRSGSSRSYKSSPSRKSYKSSSRSSGSSKSYKGSSSRKSTSKGRKW